MRRATPLALGPFAFLRQSRPLQADQGLVRHRLNLSPSARQTAEQLSKRIVLIDGDQLTRLVIRHGVGCRIEETLYIKKVDEEFFE
jgi:restriction system protein